MGANLAGLPLGRPSRWIVDFSSISLESAERYLLPFNHLKEHVRPERLANSNTDLHASWWQHWRPRPAMRKALEKLPFYFAVPEVSKWFIFLECEASWLSGNNCRPVASKDYYLLGLLTSSVHRLWVNNQKSTLKGDTRYNHKTCFETFPFPQLVTAEQAEAIRQQMVELNDYRNSWMVEQQKGITAYPFRGRDSSRRTSALLNP
jgi:hypothetical protein